MNELSKRIGRLNENRIPWDGPKERTADKPACVDGSGATIPKSIFSF